MTLHQFSGGVLPKVLVTTSVPRVAVIRKYKASLKENNKNDY